MPDKQKQNLYVKARDRPRRSSPREDDADGRLPSEVEVQNYGEGHISADADPQWPRKNFEEDDTESPSPTTSELPARAKKYVVDSNSLKDLTGAKFITVPESKVSKSEPSSSQTLPAGSVRLYSHGGLTGRAYQQPSSPSPSPVRTEPRIEGTFKGYPVNYIPDNGPQAARHRLSKGHASTNSAHATIKSYRLPSSSHGTLRVIPTSVSGPKGFSLGANATLRSHNTGHAVQQMMQRKLAGWDNPVGTVAFKRGTTREDKKEYHFTQFRIELDRPEMDFYTPGETMSGRIIIEVDTKIEIRFVELLIVGLGSLQVAKSEPNNPNTSKEVVLSKRSYVMGTADGRWNSVIMPGKYISRFRFALPEGLPSTMKFVDNGFDFEVSYIVKARICDELGSSSARSTHSMNNYVKVLMSRRHPFIVKRAFDIHAIPKALLPIEHSEYVNISCLPGAGEAATVTLALDRAVFLAGDEIRIRLITSNKTSLKIKSLTCELQQRMNTALKTKSINTISRLDKVNPAGTLMKQKSNKVAIYEFIIPTNTNCIPSFLTGCHFVRVGYAVVMAVRFKSCSGKLLLETPIGIGPCTDPAVLDSTNTVPVFKRPKRFPNFSPSPETDLQNGVMLQNGEAVFPRKRLESQVSSTYRTAGRSFFCCWLDSGKV